MSPALMFIIHLSTYLASPFGHLNHLRMSMSKREFLILPKLFLLLILSISLSLSLMYYKELTYLIMRAI